MLAGHAMREDGRGGRTSRPIWDLIGSGQEGHENNQCDAHQDYAAAIMAIIPHSYTFNVKLA